MAKRDKKSAAAPSENSPTATTTTTTISNLRLEADLWYRIKVLLYDLSNLANDPTSGQRLGLTTNELYISEPYFTNHESQRIRTASVDIASSHLVNHSTSGEPNTPEHESEIENQLIVAGGSTPTANPTPLSTTTLENAVQLGLMNFFEKRRASGDARPCGPHDLIPVYTSVFGIAKEDLKEERFLARLRRSGLGDSKSGKEPRMDSEGSKDGKGKRKEKRPT